MEGIHQNTKMLEMSLVESLGDSIADIEAIDWNDEDSFSFGPVYHIKTSSGLALSVHPITVVDKSDKDVKSCYLLACSEQGVFVGQRVAAIERMPKNFYVNGSIGVVRRGEGVSTAIDMVFLDFLSKIATEGRAPVIWNIQNANMSALRKMEEDFSKNPTPELQVRINKKRKEQSRWRAVYGEGGRLNTTRALPGGDVYFEKKIFPNRDSDKNFKEIWLERVSEDGVGIVSKGELITSKEDFIKDRKKDLVDILNSIKNILKK